MHQEGRRVILEPVEEWSEELLGCLGAWAEDIPRPLQVPETDLKDPAARSTAGDRPLIGVSYLGETQCVGQFRVQPGMVE